MIFFQFLYIFYRAKLAEVGGYKMLESYQTPKFKESQLLEVSRELVPIFKRRRTIRHFSDFKPNREIIMNAIQVAGLAPSGANKQPWSFVIIEKNELKKHLRDLAEKEEYRFYVEKPNKQWIKDLSHLHCNVEKEFMTQAPYLIAIFYRHFEIDEVGEKSTNYYAKESAGIATGMLISALHLSGLSTLTYTPKRMTFLANELGRPAHERTFMLLAAGLPHEKAQVPVITKKSLQEICDTYS